VLYSPERFHSLILGGGGTPHVHDQDVHSGSILLWLPGTQAVVAALRPVFGPWRMSEMKARLPTNDPEPRIAALLVREQLDFEDVHETLSAPRMVISGELDTLPPETAEIVGSMHNATSVCLRGPDSASAVFHTGQMLPQIGKLRAESDES
jgi:hypothetical protein